MFTSARTFDDDSKKLDSIKKNNSDFQNNLFSSQIEKKSSLGFLCCGTKQSKKPTYNFNNQMKDMLKTSPNMKPEQLMSNNNEPKIRILGDPNDKLISKNRNSFVSSQKNKVV